MGSILDFSFTSSLEEVLPVFEGPPSPHIDEADVDSLLWTRCSFKTDSKLRNR